MAEEDETRKKSGKMPNFAEYERQRILDAASHSGLSDKNIKSIIITK